MANALANPLMDDDSGLGNSLTAPTGNPRHFYQTGEDGNWYNDSGDRVYYWVPPSETDSTIRSGGETQGIGQDLGGYYTEVEIAEAYNADEGMGYLKENVNWDSYWGFISERQGEIQAGNLLDPIQGEYTKTANKLALGSVDPDAITSDRQEEAYYAQMDANRQAVLQQQMGQWVNENAALMGKYGISGVHQNNDGDYFAFNGSTYSRVYKQEGVDWGQIVASVMIGSFTGFAFGEIMQGLAGLASGGFMGGGEDHRYIRRSY